MSPTGASNWINRTTCATARAVARYSVAALVAIVSLAIGIGAMTLTVRDVVFRKPPPLYDRPGQLSFVRMGRPERQMSDPYDASTPGTLFRSGTDASLPGMARAAASLFVNHDGSPDVLMVTSQPVSQIANSLVWSRLENPPARLSQEVAQ